MPLYEYKQEIRASEASGFVNRFHNSAMLPLPFVLLSLHMAKYSEERLTSKVLVLFSHSMKRPRLVS
jgi:hypothetical protein